MIIKPLYVDNYAIKYNDKYISYDIHKGINYVLWNGKKYIKGNVIKALMNDIKFIKCLEEIHNEL